MRLPRVAVPAVAAVLFAALAVAVAARLGPLFAADLAISDAARRVALAHPAWHSLMAAVTFTGSTTVLGPVAALGCLALLRARRGWPAVLVAVTLPVTLAVRLLLADGIARPRPVDRLAAASGWSFPSGHTTASATVALLAVLVGWPLLRSRRSRAVLVAAAAVWAFAVGLSRVALVVHWPSDVLGAWLYVAAIVPALAMLLARGRSPAAAPVTDESATDLRN